MENDWQEESPLRQATYNYLPPGEYEFQVRACNNDGVGFQPDADTHAIHGNGLENMSKRMEMAGGSVRLVSQPDRGTALHFTVPLPPHLPGRHGA